MRGNVLRLSASALLLMIAAAPVVRGQVTLPLPQLEELRARAHPPPEGDPAPPLPFALETAEVAIDAGAEGARVVQTLDLVLYGEGTLSVPLGEAGSFTGARFGDLQGRVDAQPSGWALEVRGRGRHRVVLESVVPLVRDETATRPTWQLALRFPPAAVVRGTLRAPAAVEEAELGGNGLLTRAPGGGWSFVATGGAAVGLTLHGKRSLPERALLPLRYEATTATAVMVSRTRLKVRGWVQARVAQGRLEALRIPLPPGLEVAAVEGPLAGWTVEEGTLSITPLEPIESTFAVGVSLEGKPEATFASPLLVPTEGHRVVLLTRAVAEGDGLVQLVEPGATRLAVGAEVAPLPASLRDGGPMRAVLDAARPPRWAVEWADRSEVLAAQVDRLLVDVAMGASGRAAYQLWAEVRNRGAQQLVVTLPPGFELVEGSRDGEPVAAGAGPGGLAVPLAGGEARQVVHLLGVLPLSLPSGGADFALPLPALSAPAGRVEVRLLLPGGRRYALADPSRGSAVQGPPATAEAVARRRAVPTTNVIAQQFRAAAPVCASTSGLFPIPPGFGELDAVWSAVSATPAPLALHVRSQQEETPWF